MRVSVSGTFFRLVLVLVLVLVSLILNRTAYIPVYASFGPGRYIAAAPAGVHLRLLHLPSGFVNFSGTRTVDTRFRLQVHGIGYRLVEKEEI